jgi:hypothetical protein
VEEGYAKEQLDKKIQCEQDMELLTEETDLVEKRKANGMEDAKTKEELEKLTISNKSLTKNNTTLDRRSRLFKRSMATRCSRRWTSKSSLS